MSNIELSTIVEQRVANIFLDDECPQTAIAVLFSTLQPQSNILNIMVNFNTVASIAKLSRFHDPNIDDLTTLQIHGFMLMMAILRPFPL